MSTTRRDLIASVAAAATVGLSPLRLAAETTDPAVSLSLQGERARARAQAASDRVRAIEAAHPEPMMGQGYPRLDKSVPALLNVSAPDGEPISRGDLGKLSSLSWPGVTDARLRWWDDTMALMERRAIETGYKAANEDSERLWAEFNDLASTFAEVEATTLAGAFCRLSYAVEVIRSRCPPDDLYPYERALLGAADFERLAKGNVP